MDSGAAAVACEAAVQRSAATPPATYAVLWWCHACWLQPGKAAQQRLRSRQLPQIISRVLSCCLLAVCVLVRCCCPQHPRLARPWRTLGAPACCSRACCWSCSGGSVHPCRKHSAAVPPSHA
jgi:hypothetical protein